MLKRLEVLNEQVMAMIRHHQDFTLALHDALAGRQLTPEQRSRFRMVAEVEDLVQDQEDIHATHDRMADLLSQTAAALKGKPPASTYWSWHDLPAITEAYRTALIAIASSSANPFTAEIASKALRWREHGTQPDVKRSKGMGGKGSE